MMDCIFTVMLDVARLATSGSDVARTEARRIARERERRSTQALTANETGFVRDERLERAGYLLVVGIDRLVRAIGAFGWRIVRFLTRRSVTAERRSVRAGETRA
jgi:hypothetical protein